MLCKHHFSKNGQVFFHIFWVVTLIMQSRILFTFIASMISSSLLVSVFDFLRSGLFKKGNSK
ncbi:hypothetical protein EQK34_14395 [Lacticaseibacillus paracasei]|nr:hypothetical protein EQK34_14395 [Lacticaseibacillus paracasei]